MRATTTLLLTLTLTPLIAACGADGAARSDSDGGSARTSIVATASHPCDAFTAADVASHFDVAEDAVTTERSENPGGILCQYRWAKADSAAISERNAAAIMEAMMPGGGGIKALPKEREHVELSITFPTQSFGSAAEAREALETMVQRLEKGVSGSSGDQTFSFSTSFDESAGVADRAVWSGNLRQVSAVSGNRLYHVMLHDNVDPAADRPVAEDVARKIVDAL